MKTTIKLTTQKSIVVDTSKVGKVVLITSPHSEPLFLTIDQVGALIFGLEQAAEALEIQQQRTATVAGAAVL